MTRIAIISFALTSLVAATGCEKTETTVPDEPAAKAWAPAEGEFEAEQRNEEEQAPFLSARHE